MIGLTIKTDRSEYSRNEPSRSTVRCRVLADPATGLNDTVLLALRKVGGPVIATLEVPMAGDLPKGVVASFDLTTIKDADGIPLATRGQYVVDGYTPVEGYTDPETPDLVTATSAAFRVAIITVEEMRKGYCFGVPLTASDQPAAKRQPSVVTGVRLTKLSDGTQPGIHALVFDQAANTLSWAGGPAIPIGGSSEILPDQFGGYAEAEIDEFELPIGDASEGIVVDKEDLTDDFIRGEIDKAIAEVENIHLKIYMEPTRVATEPYYSAPAEGEHFDRKADPVMFTRRDFNANGLAWHLDLPLHQLLKVNKLAGYMGNSLALVVEAGALTANRKQGMVDVLPYNSQYSYLYTFFTQLHFWGTREFIADFWRYTGVAGFEETPADVLRLIGYTAGMAILTIAGQGYRGGFSSESVSKDGVSRSVSYTASAMYGIYSATINDFTNWIKANLPRIREQYRGLPMVVL